MAFIRQSAPNIRKKLQRIEGLQDYTIRDVVKEAEKVYHKRETEDEKQEREKREKREDEDRRDRKRLLTRILATVVDRDKRDRTRQSGDLGDEKRQGPRRPRRDRPPLEKDQCVYCKDKVTGPGSAPKSSRGQKCCPLMMMKSRGDGAQPPPPV